MCDVQLEESIADETQKLAKMTEAHKSNKEKHASLESDVQKSEELLQTLLTGVSSKQDKNNTGGGYMGQLAEAKARLAQGKAEEEQSRVKLGMRERELAELKRKMKEFEREAGESQKKLKDMRVVVEQFRGKLGKCKWNQELEEQLEAKLKGLRQRTRELSDVCFHNHSNIIFDANYLRAEARAYQAGHEPPQLRIFGPNCQL